MLDMDFMKMLKRLKRSTRFPAVIDNLPDVDQEDGGPGSGNFGHAGRPGEVGGSKKGSGGALLRTGSKETGFSGVKHAAFVKVAEQARTAKSYNDWIINLSKGSGSGLQVIQDQFNQVYGGSQKEDLGDYAERLYTMLHMRNAKNAVVQKGKPVVGRDISHEWKRRSDQIEFEIDDVMNAQGFDGVPKIVDSGEFDRIIEENKDMPILFRSYVAPNKETLKEYDKTLEKGDWYVDCSTGGAQYGNGMYCAGVFDRDDRSIDGAIVEMRHYRELNMDRQMDSLRDRGFFQDEDGNSYVPAGEEIDINDVYMNITKEGPVFIKNKYDENALVTWNDGLGVWVDRYGDSYYWDEIKSFKHAQQVEAWKPVATTRRMTLDPSAKIITYDEANALFRKMNSEDEPILSTVAEYDDAWNRALDKHGLRKVVKKIPSANFEVYKALFSANSTKERKAEKAKFFTDNAVQNYLPDEKQREYKQAFRDVIDDVMSELSFKKTDNVSVHDVGSAMVLLGYDAINAEGHGDSGSYVVVLNRTKVILDKNAVEV